LDFHESGKMEDLDNKWILLNKEVKCDSKDDNSPATLGLSNMRGVFILVGVGIVGGLGLIVIEIIFKKHQKRKNKKDSIAKTAVRKWKGNLEKRKTIRESHKKLKSNGFRGSTSASALVRTPDSSLTLSVGSLPQRPMHPSEAQHFSHTQPHSPWPRSPSEENLSEKQPQLPPPPVYREATRLSKEDLRYTLVAGSSNSDHTKVNLLMNNSDDEEIPPPVPPHRTSFERPKSAMSIDEPLRRRSPAGGEEYRYYDEVEIMTSQQNQNKHWRGSRERLLDQHAGHHMYSNKLHRSLGSGLENYHQPHAQQLQPQQPQNVKSPSSSDSSRKKNTKVLVISANNSSGPPSEAMAAIVNKPITPSRNKRKSTTSSPLWSNNSKVLDHDLLSSPEYPSTSSDLRMIPQPPPPPKVYYVQQSQHQQRLANRGRHPMSQAQQQQQISSQSQHRSAVGRPAGITTPLSHHPNAVLAQRRHRGSIGVPHYISNDDSDV